VSEAAQRGGGPRASEPARRFLLARDPRTWLAVVVGVAALFGTLHATLDTESSYGDDQALGPPFAPVVESASTSLSSAFRDRVFQPMALASLATDRHLWADEGRGGRITNLALHIANTLLVYVLSLVLLGAARAPGRPAPATLADHVASLLAALLFGLHPLRVEAVVWVAWRGVLLSTFFVLLGTILYVRGSVRGSSLGGLTASLVCFVVSLAVGPFGLAFPLLLVVLDRYPLRRFRRRAWLEKVPLLAIAVAAVVAGVVGRGSSPTSADTSILPRLAQSALAPVFYVWKTTWPTGLMPLYELHEPLKWLSLKYLGSIAAVLIAVVLLLRYARRLPAVAVAAACYLLSVLPAVWLVQRGFEEAGDRYAYLPGVPLALLVGGGLWWLLSRREAAVRWIGVGATVLGLAAAPALGYLSRRQCDVWRTPTTLWTYVNDKGPPAGVARYRLGLLRAKEGQIERAAQLYQGAITVRPTLIEAHLALGDALLRMTRVEKAIRAYRRALRLDPARADTHQRLGQALAAREEFDTAEEHLRRAALLAPTDPASRASLGHLLMILKRWGEAAEVFDDALRLAPEDADLCYDLGRAQQHAGQLELARKSFQQALRLDPEHELAKLALLELEQEEHTDRGR